MFSQGARVECNLTDLSGREGLYTGYYPGTFESLRVYTGIPFYRVKLDDFAILELDPFRVTPARTDRCPPNYVFTKDEEVQVLEYDSNIPVWWDATVVDPTLNEQSKVLIRWKFNNMLARAPYYEIRLDSPPKEIPPYVCPLCDETLLNGKRAYCTFKMCASCYVEDCVDGLLDVMDEREQHTKRCKPEVYYSKEYNKVRNDVLTRRMWIKQVGGQTQRKDQRLFNQLENAFQKMDRLLVEHPDEEEYDE